MAFDAASNGRTSSGTSQTVSHTCSGTNRGLFVGVIGDGSDKITGVTYAGVSMSLVAKALLGSSRWGYLFYLSAPATGTNNIVASASSASYIEIDAASYTGVSQSGQPEASATNAGASSVSSTTSTVTTVTNNAWVVGIGLGQTGTITAGANTTVRTTNLVGALIDSGGAVTPAGSRSLVHNMASNGGMGGVVASIAPEAGTDGTANGSTVTATASMNAGSASSGTDASASGATMTVTASEIAGAAGGIGFADVVNYRVIQRAAGVGSLSISGTHSGATSVQARVVQYGTSTEVLGWTTIDASPGASTWSGTLTNIPEGGWYSVQVRQGNATSFTAVGANRFGVGVLIAAIGQSQARNWFDNGANITPNSLLVQYTGSAGTGWAARTTTGNGANAFGNALITALGGSIPVGLLKYGVGATSLRQEADGGSGYWMNTAGGSPYALFLAGANSTGGKLEGAVWAQGEQDGFSNLVTESEYSTDLATLFARVRSDLGQSSLPIVVMPLGRYTNAGPTDASWQGIQNALAAVGGQSNNYLAATVLDLALTDGVHYTDAAYTTHGTRAARAMRYALGLSAYRAGPIVSSVQMASGTTVRVNMTHGGGSDFTPTSAITGFEVFGNGSAATISSAVRDDSDSVLLTLSAAPSDPVTVRYLYGRNPTITSPVKDDTSETLPLQSFDSMTATSGATADGVTLAPSASLVAGGAGGGAAGQVFSATASLIAGSFSVSNPADGALLISVASLMAGSAAGGGSASAAGVTVGAATSLLTGSATGEVNGAAAGVVFAATAALIAGSASADNSGTALGVTFSLAAALVPGGASGQFPGDATGATLVGAVSLIAGAAFGPLVAATPGYTAKLRLRRYSR